MFVQPLGLQLERQSVAVTTIDIVVLAGEGLVAGRHTVLDRGVQGRAVVGNRKELLVSRVDEKGLLMV